MEAILVGLCAPHWQLTVWSNDVQSSQKRLAATLAARGKPVPAQLVRVSPVEGVTWRENAPVGEPPSLCSDLPILFENLSYEFEFQLVGCTHAYVRHRSRVVSEAFRFDKSTLRGTLNFGNAIGWFNLEVVVVAEDEIEQSYALALEVHPTKLDLTTDLAEMLGRIDGTYPLWRFSYARMTEQSMNRARKPFERLPLIWLEQFKSLRAELERSVKLVCNTPHSRLQESGRRRRLEQLHGKLSSRQEEKVAQALAAGERSQRFTVVTRRLSVDTPENRFVLAVMEYCDRELGRFQRSVSTANDRNEHRTASDYAVAEIEEWRRSIQSLRANRLWSEVGSYSGTHRESLVLQDRAGYSGVYRVWLQLRMYLDVLGRHASISMKAVSELYEIWCFLEILKQLQNLGFILDNVAPPRIDVIGLEAALKDGMGAAFQMHRGSRESGDLVVLRLAHEPLFGARNRNRPGTRVVSWLNAQRPDIVLEATFPDEQRLFWVFDAKYRIRRNDDQPKVDDTDDIADDDVLPSGDMAPADAINQMHRYRDAIIRAVADEQAYPQLSRPVVGAFCLYPGWYPDVVQNTQYNPYQDAIEAVGIGAFPTLPGQENVWLRMFLSSQLGPKHPVLPRSPGPEWQLAQWAPRIGQVGLRLQQPHGLVFMAHIGGSRTAVYRRGFETGTAQWFHVQSKALVRGEIAPSAMQDVTYCGIAYTDDSGASSHITHVYKLLAVSLVERGAISAEQAGATAHGSSDKYWLFQLGASEELDSPIHYERVSPFRAWLTSLSSLTKLKLLDSRVKRAE